MPETWPIIALLLTIIGAISLLLWRTSQARHDERERNSAKWQDEFRHQLRSIDMKLSTIDLLDMTLKRVMEDLKEMEKSMDTAKDRFARLERDVNGKRVP